VPPDSPSEPPWMRACAVLSWVLAGASPLVLYLAVARGRLEEAALVLLAFAALRAVPALLRARREHLVAALRLPLVAVLSAAVGVLTREPRALLVLPSASQLAFGAVFLTSLRTTPLVEHFARMKHPELDAERARYCRTVTLVWGVTLTVAAFVGLALAAWASLATWTVFTGVGSYALVAILSSGEYVIRKVRFRDFGAGLIDRMLRRALVRPSGLARRELDLPEGDDVEVSVEVPADYVFFRGHFDGLPILPGVAQLTEIVVPLAKRRHPSLGALTSLDRVRFRRPVFPGETIRVALGGGPSRKMTFELEVDGRVVANGSMTFEVRE